MEVPFSGFALIRWAVRLTLRRRRLGLLSCSGVQLINAYAPPPFRFAVELRRPVNKRSVTVLCSAFRIRGLQPDNSRITAGGSPPPHKRAASSHCADIAAGACAVIPPPGALLFIGERVPPGFCPCFPLAVSGAVAPCVFCRRTERAIFQTVCPVNAQPVLIWCCAVS